MWPFERSRPEYSSPGCNPDLDNRWGFTLIELLVVLVLIGFMSSLVFVAVTGGIFRSEDARFVQAFRQNLVHARAASLGRGELVRFLIDGEERVIFFEGGRRYRIPETIQVEGSGVAEVLPGVFAVFFYPDGSSSGGEIDLRWEDGSLERVTVDRLLGIIRMEHVAS
jgi:general secretion pathway protein H